MNALTRLGRVTSLGVSGKFSLAIISSLIVFCLVLAVVILGLERGALDDVLKTSQRIVEKMTDEQIQGDEAAARLKAQQLLRMLAEMAPGPIAEMDLSLLLEFTHIAVDDPDISYVALRNASNLTMAKAGSPDGARELLKKDIEVDGVKLGEVEIGYNLVQAHGRADVARREFAESQKVMSESKTETLRNSALGIAALLIVFGLVFSSGTTFLVTIVVKRPLEKVVDAAQTLASGDLRTTVKHDSNDELGHLAKVFNVMTEHFRGVIHEVNGATSQLAVASEQMAAITEQANTGIQQQKADTEQVAAAMNEMNATVQDVARSTVDAANIARSSKEEAENGHRVVSGAMETIDALANEVDRTAQVIKELNADSENIGVILDVIREVAEQTNLLALNAAIEAARAGEHGRGFAVVADEVRTLAQRTQQSTTDIQNVIEKLQARAQRAVEAMEGGREKTNLTVEQASNALGSLRLISEAVARIHDMNAQIASAAEEQTSVVEEMNKNVVNINTVAEQSAQSTHELEAASNSLSELAMRLQTLVSHFKV